MKYNVHFWLAIGFLGNWTYGAQEEQALRSVDIQLLRACQNPSDNVERVKMLVEKQGANALFVDFEKFPDGNDSVHTQALLERTQIVQQEMEKDATVYPSQQFWHESFQKSLELPIDSPLAHAILCGNENVATYLVEYSQGQHHPIRFTSSQSQLFIAAILHQKPPLIQILEQVGARILDSELPLPEKIPVNNIVDIAKQCNEGQDGWKHLQTVFFSLLQIKLPDSARPRIYSKTNAKEVYRATLTIWTKESREQATYTFFRNMFA